MKLKHATKSEAKKTGPVHRSYAFTKDGRRLTSCGAVVTAGMRLSEKFPQVTCGECRKGMA